MNKVNVNMTPCNDVVTLHCSQGDTEARKFYVKLHNNGEKIDSSSITDQMVFKAYEGGTEEILPTNGSTPTTSPIIADIKYPQGLLTDQEFLYRQSPTEEDGYAKIETIYGNTLVWNQLATLFGSTSTVNGITFTKGDTYYSVSGTNTGTISQKKVVDKVPLTLNHKYLIKGCPSGGSQQTYRLSLWFNNDVTATPNNDYGSGVIIDHTTAYANDNLSLYIDVYPNATVSNLIFTPQLFDLTLMFGAGKEPSSVSEFVELFSLSYYSYNSGSLLSFNGTGIKTTGKNLVYKVIENANLESDGRISSSSYRIACAEITQGVQYHITSGATATNAIVGFFTSDPVIGSVAYDGQRHLGSPLTFTAPITGYIVFRCVSTFEFPQLEIGSTATTYEPFKSSTIDIPTSTYFPTGMKSARNAYDELTDSKAIVKIGAVDLGTLNWYYTSGGQGRFASGGISSTAKHVTANTEVANIKNAKYSTISAGSVYNGNVGMAIDTSGAIWVYDTTYGTDASAFRTAMNGIYLYYELATPLENYGIVDLGTLTWYSEGTNTSGIIRMGSTGIRDFVKKPTSGSVRANIVCDLYATETADRTYLKNKGISINTGGTICVYDPNYNTSDKIASFKSAMSGVYLLYEKANPQSLTTASIVTKKGEIALAPQDEYLVGECYSNISENAGFLEAKVKLTDEDGDLYSTKIQIHVERKP